LVQSSCVLASAVGPNGNFIGFGHSSTPQRLDTADHGIIRLFANLPVVLEFVNTTQVDGQQSAVSNISGGRFEKTEVSW
jgi:hypothetical protein